MPHALLLALTLAAPPAAEFENLTHLAGTLSVFGSELRLLVEIDDSGEQVVGRFWSVDQSLAPVPLDAVSLTENEFAFTADAIGANYGGTVAGDGSYGGIFKQGLLPLKLTFERIDTDAARRLLNPPRPQTPEPPFPYRTEQVTFTNPDDGLTLAGTLSLPDGRSSSDENLYAAPYPAAVLVSGSGPQDRDETLFGHKPFAVLADALARRGVAVLRYDDRGVGESAGDRVDATTATDAADARGAVKFLADRADVDPVGVIGHSEGGLVAALLAAGHPDEIDFAVLLAGPGLVGREVLFTQAEAVIRAAGGDDAAVAENRRLQSLLFDAAAVADDDARAARLAELVDAELAKLPGADRDAARPLTAAQADRVNAAWMRHFLTLDPVPALRAVRCPLLAIFGGKDVQVVAGPNAAAVRAAVAGNPDATVKIFPDLNHLFQPATTGLPAEYGTIETTLDPAVTDLAAGWIVRRFVKAE